MENSNKPSRLHRSEEEIKVLLKEFEASDVTVKEFCEMYSISEATFYSWRNKYALRNEMRGEFIRLVNDVTASDRADIFAELELPSKAIFRFYEKLDPEFIKALM